MGKKETAKWDHFGDMLATGNSIHPAWFGRKLLGKWVKEGLVRYVHICEDFQSWGGKGLYGWNVGEVVATEKGLETL